MASFVVTFPHLLYSLNLFPHHLHELIKVEFPVSVHVVLNDKAEHLQIDQRRKSADQVPSQLIGHQWWLTTPLPSITIIIWWYAGGIIWLKYWFGVVQNWHSVSFFNLYLIFCAAEWIIMNLYEPLCSSSHHYHHYQNHFQKVVQLSGTSSSVGFWPIDRITGRSSLVEIVPLRSWKPHILATVLEIALF